MRLRLPILLLTLLLISRPAIVEADASEPRVRAAVQLFLDGQLEEALAGLTWKGAQPSPEGELLTGLIYSYGGEEFREEARERLLRAAGEGSAAAMYWLGALSFEKGCAACLDEAERWLQQPARAGDRDARKVLMAIHYWQGRFSTTDETEAEALIATGRDIAAVHAAVVLGRWLQQQPGREDRAWELYRWAAEQGDAEALYALYARLQDSDPKEAAVYLAMAALQGLGAAASIRLDPASEETAREWLARIAADRETPLGRAALWCARNGAEHYPNCLTLAATHDEQCGLPPLAMHALGLINFEDSLIYSNCRWSLLREQFS